MNINKELILSKTLKPEEINSSDMIVKAKRVQELLAWFERLANGAANPEWTTSHAYELVHYILEFDNLHKIDFDDIESKSFMKGVNISEGDRELIKRYAP